MNCYEDLMYRGLIKDVASEDIKKLLNGDKVSDENTLITKSLAIEGQIIVLKRGKKKNYILKIKEA